MKSFAQLGTLLSKDEQKRIKGGSEPEPTECASREVECTYYESGTGNVTGRCEQNSRGLCVCNAGTSSVVWTACQAG